MRYPIGEGVPAFMKSAITSLNAMTNYENTDYSSIWTESGYLCGPFCSM